MILLPLFFQCFSAVNEDLDGKKLNGQEKSFPLIQKFANFGENFFSLENIFSNNDQIIFKFLEVVK